MSVPAKRRSSSKTKRGRAHQALVKVKTIKCAKCGKVTLPHKVCASCGYYKGREITKPKIKSNKK